MKRRSVLAVLGAGTIPLAGCLSWAQFAGNNSCLNDGTVSFEAKTDEFVVTSDDNSVEMLVFTLQNHTTCPLTLTPQAWRIERKSGDGWQQVASGNGEEDQRTLSSGEKHEWSLSLAPHPTPQTEKTTFVTTDLSEGTYALVVNGTLENDEGITRRAQFDLKKQPTTKTDIDT